MRNFNSFPQSLIRNISIRSSTVCNVTLRKSTLLFKQTSIQIVHKIEAEDYAAWQIMSLYVNIFWNLWRIKLIKDTKFVGWYKYPLFSPSVRSKIHLSNFKPIALECTHIFDISHPKIKNLNFIFLCDLLEVCFVRFYLAYYFKNRYVVIRIF